jgi:KDO2-lipid IV(A) lauroyltransferase
MKIRRDLVEKRLIRRMARAMERAPWSTCRRVGSLFGMAFYYGSSRRRAIAIENIRLVFPELSEKDARLRAQRSAQNFGMSFCEFLHLRTASTREIAEYAEWQGLEHIQAAREQGCGAMLPTAHFGAWEVMAARATQDFPLTVVVRLTSNRSLRAHIEEVRKAINVEMILKSESARASLNVLRNNGALGIFPDQHAGEYGELLPMFGHPTSFFTSPARLALSAQAPIIPTFAIRRTPWLSDGRVLIKASPGLSLHQQNYASRDEAVLAGTRYIISEIENVVRAHPDQWLWMHRRWRPEDRIAESV